MRRLVVVLPLLLPLAACGSQPGDLADTCTKVSRAWPGNLYDDAATARFGKTLDGILEKADPEVRKEFADVQEHVHKAVKAKGDNRAVITESVEVLAALDDVNESCKDAEAPAIG